MVSKFATTLAMVSMMAYASMPTVNYDEQFDTAEIENINEHIVDNALTGLKLESLTFQEQMLKTAEGTTVKKNIAVKKVKAGDKVVYINRLTNETGEIKHNIVVKNPMPSGTTYIHGSAICGQGCTISYSSNQGITLDTQEDSAQHYDYIEFHFYQIPANQEVRMGFRATIE